MALQLVFYLDVPAEELTKLRMFESEVADFVKNRMGGKCRPTWQGIDKYGCHTVRLLVADLVPPTILEVQPNEIDLLGADGFLDELAHRRSRC